MIIESIMHDRILIIHLRVPNNLNKLTNAPAVMQFLTITRSACRPPGFICSFWQISLPHLQLCWQSSLSHLHALYGSSVTLQLELSSAPLYVSSPALVADLRLSSAPLQAKLYFVCQGPSTDLHAELYVSPVALLTELCV